MDRNVLNLGCYLNGGKSLSARRAWIEMYNLMSKRLCRLVALRKESVDRNDNLVLLWYITDVALRKESVDRNISIMRRRTMAKRSLSARRAWIEMLCHFLRFWGRGVALRKESVDRNWGLGAAPPDLQRRSPQGERG